MNRDFEAGEPISEYKISERLSLSRTPVREALKRLELRGLLESFPGRGMFVRRYTVKDVIEISEVMREVECIAIRKMVANPNPQDIAVLREIAQAQERALNDGDLPAAVTLGRRFHSRISDHVDNTRLRAALDEAAEQSDYLSRIEVQTNHGHEITMTALQEHLRIVDLLADGDGDAVEALMRQHLTTHESELLLLASAGVL